MQPGWATVEIEEAEGAITPPASVSPVVVPNRSLRVMLAETTTDKPRKRPTAKTAKPQANEKVKVTLYLDSDLAKRFAVHATYSDMDKSQLFAEMVRQNCNRFVVQDRKRPADDRPSYPTESAV